MMHIATGKTWAKRAVVRTLRALKMEGILRKLKPELRINQPLARALEWVRRNELPSGGIRLHSRYPEAYPEVTGYLIPSLLRWGEHDLAVRLARWLISLQSPEGAWLDPFTHKPYTFDTGQILKGLLAVRRRLPEADPAIRLACDWFLTQIGDDGRILTPDTAAWRQPQFRDFNEHIHLYALEGLRDAGRLFGEPRYERAAEHALGWYLARPALTGFVNLSHFHAYVLEALVDLDRGDLAERGMAEVASLQRPDGAVPAYWDVRWVCSTGLAQYAVIWYKLGRLDRAQKALGYVLRLQNRSGGFYGSYGARADYFARSEIAWVVKYFLDACHWHVRTAFDHLSETFYLDLPESDARVRAVLDGLGDVSGKRVLDAGCGRGAFARRLLARYPSAQVTGLDLSRANLSWLPPEVKPVQGTFLDLPFDDASFDGAWCVDALQHAINPRAVVAEICRVVRPGGRVVIVDKDRLRRGRLRTEAWEQWFAREEVEAWLRTVCTDVSSHVIDPPVEPGLEGLYLVWRATRR